MFFIKKKRCKYCAGELKDGKCTNSNCIKILKAPSKKKKQ